MATIICSDWGCNREGTQVRADIDALIERAGGDALATLLKKVICNVHAGAAKRKAQGRWGSYYTDEANLIRLDDRPDLKAILQAHFDRLAEEARVRAKAAAEQRALENEARFAQAWVERSNEPEYTVEQGIDMRSYDDHYRDGFTVKAEHEDRTWDAITVRVEQDGRWPAAISLNTTGRWSPARARALAKALELAANLADIRDTAHGPNGA
jgi:hypothetical protein